MYRVACRIVDPEAAEDVAQDAMLLAYRHRDSYRGDARYHTWLYRIAATAAFGYLRKRRRSPELLPPDDAAHERAPDPSGGPDELLSACQQTARALAALERLAPMYRDVVLLRLTLSEAATAARLGISVANVKVRAHRARRLLRTANDQVSTSATPG
ncbi:MAG: sigma-70 family RNA polymerase sigma factor [Deltaproteobacteria bacterium]|nr:sigma-70 family RNA polymerase sigma factor [Deltaproteobacteria bacterium]